MRYSIYIVAALFVSLCFNSALLSSDQPSFRVFIKLDKRIYYTNEEIVIKVFVKNISSSKAYFYKYDSTRTTPSDYTTFQPIIVDKKGNDVKTIVEYQLANKQIQDHLPNLEKRLVELGPGESQVFPINLSSLFQFATNNQYRLIVNFFPDCAQPSVVKSANDLSFKIIESRHTNTISKLAGINREIAPKEVVRLVLSAEKEHDWNNYIKFINVEKFISVYPDFINKYQYADANDKSSVEHAFIQYLTTIRDNGILDFQIQSEEYSDNNAYVDVIVDRFGIRKTNRYRYRFTLEKYSNLWLITDLEATILKGIKR